MKKGTNFFSEDEILVSKGSEDYLYHLNSPLLSDINNNIPTLRHILNAARTKLGSPILVNSWLRTPIHNKEVGGVPNSHHLIGAAADIRPKDPKKLTKLYNILYDLLEYHVIGELIRYDNFIHVALYD